MSKTKGKKFTAAEKHFIGKEMQYRRRIKMLEETYGEALKLNEELKKQCLDYQTELRQLKEWNERLLQYADLSESDIKKACEKDKAAADAFKSITGLIGFSAGLTAKY